jgi:hypothetical protein
VREITFSDLKRSIIESLLSEGPEQTEVTDDSLDAQIDRYFAQYEKESKREKFEGVDLRTITTDFLREAEGEDDDSETPPEEAEADDVSEPEKMTLEQLDIDSFANAIARLIDNYDSLLEVKNTIVRRAKNFLSKNYESDVMDSFVDVLRDDHGIDDEMSKMDVDAEKFQAPAADRAGPEPAGAP